MVARKTKTQKFQNRWLPMVNLTSLFLMIFGTMIGSVGALVIKKSSSGKKLFQMLNSKFLWLGFFLYGISTIFYVLALKKEQLSVIYPLASMSYLWVTLLSIKYLGEKMNKWKYLALLGIILGVVMIGIGS